LVDIDMPRTTIDAFDIKIVRLLQGNARISFQEIASQEGVSTDTVNNRYKALVKKGIIRGTTIVIDPTVMNQQHIVSIGIQVVNPHAEEVLLRVKTIRGMQVVTRSIGRYDIEAIAIVKDIQEIHTIKSTISDFQQVRDVDIEIWVEKPLLCPKNFEFGEVHP
jgi:DNA-binding Lrp family transcriptional regulator